MSRPTLFQATGAAQSFSILDTVEVRSTKSRFILHTKKAILWCAAAVLLITCIWLAASRSERLEQAPDATVAALSGGKAGTAGSVNRPSAPAESLTPTTSAASPKAAPEALHATTPGNRATSLSTDEAMAPGAPSVSERPAELAATPPSRPAVVAASSTTKPSRVARAEPPARSTHSVTTAARQKVDKPPHKSAPVAARPSTKNADPDVELLSALMLHMGNAKPTAITPRPLPEQDCDAVVAKARQAVFCITGTKQGRRASSAANPVH